MKQQTMILLVCAALAYYVFFYKPKPAVNSQANTGSPGPLVNATQVKQEAQGTFAQQAVQNGIGIPFTDQGYYAGFNRL